MEFERKMISQEHERSQSRYYPKPKIQPSLFAKSREKSVDTRKEGNRLFGKKDHTAKAHEKIWKLYTTSIATAVKGSEELAAGYANRSTLLLHLRKYEECSTDVERALKLTDSEPLRVKLLCRMTECFVALQEGTATRARTCLRECDFGLSILFRQWVRKTRCREQSIVGSYEMWGYIAVHDDIFYPLRADFM